MKMLLFALVLLAQRPTAPAVGTGTVTGRLLNDDGSPAVRIRVSAVAFSDNMVGNNSTPTLLSQTETDGNGIYRLTDVPSGRYYVIAGFVDSPTYYPRGSGPGEAIPVVVTANAAVANIDFRIEKPSTGYIVSGKVTHEMPPQRIQQVVLTGGDHGASIQVDTMPNGSFEFQRVRPGYYTISVSGGAFNQPRTLTVTDKNIGGLELRIPWTGDVNGRVTLDTAGPIPSLQLAFSGLGRYVTTYSQINQAFRATLPEGFFGIIVSNLPSGFFVKSITSGKTDLLSQPLRVTRDGPVPEILVALGVSTPSVGTPGPWFKVSGHVKGTRPSPTSRIQLNGPGGSLLASISADGSFEFPRVLPGAHTASFDPQPIWPQRFSLSVPHRDLTGIEIAAPITKEISRRIVVESGGQTPRVALLLTHPAEYPDVPTPRTLPSLAQVLLSRLPTPLRSDYPLPLKIEPDGSFKALLPAGQYPIKVGLTNNAAPSPFSVKSFDYGAINLMKEPIEVTESNPAELKITFAAANGRSEAKVSGRVWGFTSAAQGSVTVQLSSAAFGPLSVPVRADGTFEFAGVYPDTYLAEVTGMQENVGSPVSVLVAGNDVSGVELGAPPMKEISGRVVLEGPGSMPRFVGLALTRASAMKTAPVISKGQMHYVTINPRTDGTFRIMVPEGEYQVGRQNGMSPGYALKSVHYGSIDVFNTFLKVSATDTVELRVTLTTPDQ